MAILIPAGNPGPLTGSGNNTWLIDGRVPALIDAGVGAPAHLDAIARALCGRPLALLLITHGHADHISGAGAIRARWPEVTCARFGADEPGWRALRDGERVDAGGRALDVIHTPGHAADHVCFHDADARDLYAGDMLSRGSTVMVPPRRKGGGLRDYMASLERMAALGPQRILPGHGPIIDAPLALIRLYVDHRRVRERQVQACLADGVTDVDAIVAKIYPGLEPALLPAARLTVEGHLEKIQEDTHR